MRLTAQQLEQFDKLYLKRHHADYNIRFANWLAGTLKNHDPVTQLDTLLATTATDTSQQRWLQSAFIEAFAPQLLRILADQRITDDKKTFYLNKLSRPEKRYLIRFLFDKQDASTSSQVLPTYRLLFTNLAHDPDLARTLVSIYSTHSHKFNASLIDALCAVVNPKILMQFLTTVSANNESIINQLFKQLADLTGISGKSLYYLVQTGQFPLTKSKIATISHHALADFWQISFKNNHASLSLFSNCTINKASRVLLRLIEQQEYQLACELYQNHANQAELLNYLFVKNRCSALLTAYKEAHSSVPASLQKALIERFCYYSELHHKYYDAKTLDTFVRVIVRLAEDHLDIALACYRALPESPAKYLLFTNPKGSNTIARINRLNQLRLVCQLNQTELKRLDARKPGYLNSLSDLYRAVSQKIMDEKVTQLVAIATACQVDLSESEAQHLIADLISAQGLANTTELLGTKLNVTSLPQLQQPRDFKRWLLTEAPEPRLGLEGELLSQLLTASASAFKQLANTIWIGIFSLDSRQPKLAEAIDHLLQYTLNVQIGLLQVSNPQSAYNILTGLFNNALYQALAARLFIGLAQEQQHGIFKPLSAAQAAELLINVYNCSTQKSMAQEVVIRLFKNRPSLFTQLSPDIAQQAKLLHTLLTLARNQQQYQKLALDLLQTHTDYAALIFVLLPQVEQEAKDDILNMGFQDAQQAAHHLCRFTEIFTAGLSHTTDTETIDPVKSKTYQEIVYYFFHVQNTQLIKDSIDHIILAKEFTYLRHIIMSYFTGQPPFDTNSDAAPSTMRDERLSHFAALFTNEQQVDTIFSILANTYLDSYPIDAEVTPQHSNNRQAYNSSLRFFTTHKQANLDEKNAQPRQKEGDYRPNLKQ